MANRDVKVVKRLRNRPFLMQLPKTASTAFDKNSLVELTSGTLGASDDNDTSVLGILLEEVAATDTDYASATNKDVEVLISGDLIEIDYTGSAPTVGVTYGISNAYTLDQGDTTNDCLFVLSVNTATTRCVCSVINPAVATAI